MTFCGVERCRRFGRPLLEKREKGRTPSYFGTPSKTNPGYTSALKWPTRPALRVFCNLHYRFVIFALLIIAIVITTASVTKVKGTCFSLVGKRIVVLGDEVNPGQLVAEFRYMRFRLWKYVSVIDPTPDKKVAVEVSASRTFGRDHWTEINSKNQWFGDRTWNSYSAGSLRRDRNSWKVCVSAPKLFVSWLRWQLLDLKDTDYTSRICSTIVVEVRQNVPVMHIGVICILQPEIFKVLERNKSS